jgi:hypothetical protein
MKLLILLTILTFVGLVLVVYDPAKPYWARVGYEMDRTLNPCKYTQCAYTAKEISP